MGAVVGMGDEDSHPNLPEGLEAVVQQRVEAALDARIVQYRKIVCAFLAGFGLVAVFLISNRIISQESLLVMLHDQIFGFEHSLTREMGGSVNFSYSNEFLLQPTEPVHYLAFYASQAQIVKALIDIKHSGAGEQIPVTIRLNESANPIWAGSDDLQFRRLDLTAEIRKPAQLSPGADNVHYLTFSIDSARTAEVADRVFVRVMINVLGLERRQP
jgi:hypothetical protein